MEPSEWKVVARRFGSWVTCASPLRYQIDLNVYPTDRREEHNTLSLHMPGKRKKTVLAKEKKVSHITLALSFLWLSRLCKRDTLAEIVYYTTGPMDRGQEWPSGDSLFKNWHCDLPTAWSLQQGKTILLSRQAEKNLVQHWPHCQHTFTGTDGSDPWSSQRSPPHSPSLMSTSCSYGHGYDRFAGQETPTCNVPQCCSSWKSDIKEQCLKSSQVGLASYILTPDQVS